MPHRGSLRRHAAPYRAWLCLGAAGCLAACLSNSTAMERVPMIPSRGRRGLLLAASSVAVVQPARGFKPSDIASTYAGSDATQAAFAGAQTERKELQEALYLISRVQEATAQEERLVSTGKFKDVQRNKIKLALNMMENNYRLSDQIVTAAAYVEPKSSVIAASEIGKEAVDALMTAQDYFAKDLKVAALSDDQRKFLVTAMKTCRSKLDSFLAYLPSGEVSVARRRVEQENAKNLQEYVGESGGIINPVPLPWQ
eukprot:CAMPEP_0170579920 /NCGR_PEP_ID=MMETSP0224-20130122/6238_1 /TAXON_ID=285029 /ORGANISM="Togula jolla, Strain CCCM 725" /LENGTH=254 /DNA_ID=CAMNT_0010902971 /DNA_START=60 /DNA_END=824 /DNA_ORIENTATION=-